MHLQFFFAFKIQNSMDKHPENIICDFSVDEILWMNILTFMEQSSSRISWLLEWTCMGAVAFNNDPDIPLDTSWTNITRVMLGGKFRA